MRILIADDNPVSLRILESTLAGWGHRTVLARDGGEALRILQSAEAPPLAILDWIMPEIDGAEICRRLRAGEQSKSVYIILLTAKSTKEEVVEGLEAGADDYLTKPFDRSELKVRVQVGLRIVELQNNLANRVRELEISVAERRRAEEALRNMSLTDDLTGLYNRRGFFAFTEQNLKLTRRMKKSALLIYADMDGLKQINDTFGHQEGSRAISKTAEILRQSFRESDIIARIGGDEFAVFTPDAPLENTDCVTGKLQENIRKYNAQRSHEYELSLSVGAAKITPEDTGTIDELIVVADRAMYRDKRGKAARRQN